MNFSEMTFLETTHRLELKNDLDELARLHDWLVELSEMYSFYPRTMFRVDLVLSELITNIIEYAYADGVPHPIAVQIQYIDHRVLMIVEDRGIDFNPFDRESFEGFTTLEEANIGGLGIHLARSYSDEYDYQRIENTNRVTIVIDDRPS